MKQLIYTDATDISIPVYLMDSSTGEGKTGITASDIDVYYTRFELDGTNITCPIDLTDLNNFASVGDCMTVEDGHTDGGWAEVEDVFQPGLYRLDLPDELFIDDVTTVIIIIRDAGSNDISPCPIELQIIKQKNAGYVGGFIWVDTNSSNDGTTLYVDGTADNPVNSWAKALAMGASLDINRFYIKNGSSITLTADSSGYTLVGENYSLALGSQDISDTTIVGASVSGTGTGDGYSFDACSIGQVTLGPGSFTRCAFTSASGMTISTAGTFMFSNCYSGLESADSHIWTFPGTGTTYLYFRSYFGGVQFETMTSSDVAVIESFGQFTEGTCTGGTVTLRGNQTLSGITNITISDDARFATDQITAGACVTEQQLSDALDNLDIVATCPDGITEQQLSDALDNLDIIATCPDGLTEQQLSDALDNLDIIATCPDGLTEQQLSDALDNLDIVATCPDGITEQQLSDALDNLDMFNPAIDRVDVGKVAGEDVELGAIGFVGVRRT